MSSASDPLTSPDVPRPADPAGLDPAVSIAGPTAPPPGWWTHNWKRFVLLVTVAPCLVCGLCGLGSIGVVSYQSASTRRMDAYQIARNTVRVSEELQQVIGQPIDAVESMLLPAQGQLVKTERGTNVAIVTFYVEGPRGRAKVTAQAHEQENDWRLDQLEAQPLGHDPIVIVTPRDQGRPWQLDTEPSP